MFSRIGSTRWGGGTYDGGVLIRMNTVCLQIIGRPTKAGTTEYHKLKMLQIPSLPSDIKRYPYQTDTRMPQTLQTKNHVSYYILICQM